MNERPIDSDDSNTIEELPSRVLTEEERYYLEFAYKEPEKSIDRLEDVAKFLMGTAGTASGLLIAALKLTQATIASSLGLSGILPFLFWGLSMVCCLFVLSPRAFSVGKAEPAAWKQAILDARQWKFHWLTISTILFLFGLCSAAWSFI